MASNQQVKLFGFLGSPFVARAELALKLKGVEYEYIQEPLPNKSDLLLKYNPVHKKVPVLLHNEKPICESLLIVEYVDEAWTGSPILPSDPYDRAMSRFWSRFIDDKLLPAAFKAAWDSDVKEREKGAEESREALNVLDKELKVKGKFFTGDSFGYLEIAALIITYWLPIIQEASEVDLYSAERYPNLEKWGQEILKEPAVQAVLPPRDVLLTFFKNRYQSIPSPAMASNQQVKLFGIVGSPFVTRAEIALKLKGVEYEYIHESLTNKSDLLLKYNPVHKKVPVLLHNEKPVCESLVVVEYVDEAWTGYPILPSDPYQRALARFWSKFIDDKLLPAVFKAAWNPDVKERETGAEEAREALKILDNELKGKFFNGDSIGFLDIAALFIAFWMQLIQEAGGLDLYSAERYPKLEKWGQEILNHPVVKGVLPPREHLLAFFKTRFQSIAASK
ncbi:uncharacterized protein LOC114739655 [Neltuma alba]|uniref:uncharacterized protein LOC114739655 n=1 Tax=Neltuma alba TaxID=207710 RepID=UPI0010A53B51|nr:uncharacterized protein LOC114739655 [Prosopis alba]